MNPSTSLEQIEANRANARRSTGPVSDYGKARASQNARVHGLCSRQIHLADPEEGAIFASLRHALSTELAPAGELEALFFETILHSQWNLRRCRINEANLLGSSPDPFQNPETRVALKTLAIYTSRHERALQRALKELKALQNERASRTGFIDSAALPSPLIETGRVRRARLAEFAARPTEPVRSLQSDLAAALARPFPVHGQRV